MKMNQLIIALTISLFIGSPTFAQSDFDLFTIIQQAQSQSPRYKLASTKREIAQYQFVAFQSDFKPQISFYGNAPMYTNEYLSVTQPNGAIQFLPVRQNFSNLGFSLSQKLPFSGGEVSINSDLSRFDEFRTKYSQYNGTPLFVRINQQLFSTNTIKWQQKIETLKLAESRREFIQEMENIATQIVSQYFDVIDAQIEMEIAAGNLDATAYNLSIERKRIDLGTTTEDKLLQLELQMLNSSQSLEKSKYTYQVLLLALKSTLGYTDSASFRLLLPNKVATLQVDLQTAIDCAKKNRTEFIAFLRKKTEAQRDLAIAKSARQQVNLTASLGFNRADGNLKTVFTDLQSQQKFSIGFNIPIVDWGRRAAAYNTAKSIQKLTEYNNQMDEININQEITTLVKNIPLLRNNIELSKRVDSVAARRFEISDRLYQLGKISITDLQIARSERDNARRSSVGALRAFWNSFFLLRKLTLYDFEKGVLLVTE
jgi:outer membrane protein TolC